MNESEFDRFADEYRQLHAANISASGEAPEYFARYKIATIARLVKLGSMARPDTILDFGAGIGSSVPHFHHYFPDARLCCLDVSRKSLAVGESRFRGKAEFVHFSGEAAPFPAGQFDLVFAACVFHHIDKAEHGRILAELHRIMRPAGHLVIFEHNPLNPLTVKAVNDCPFDENAVLIRAPELAATVERAGFGTAAATYCVFFPHALRAARSLEPFLGWLPLGAQYFVHARKN